MEPLLGFETASADCVVCGVTVDQPVDIMGALAAAPDSVAQALSGAGGSAEGWSPLEVAAHLADLEVYRGMRIRRVLAEDDPEIDGVDQERWAAGLRYGERDVETAMESFAANRRANLELVRLAGEAALDRPYRHRSEGRVVARLTLRSLLVHTTHHDRGHLWQIRGE